MVPRIKMLTKDVCASLLPLLFNLQSRKFCILCLCF